MDPSKKSLQSFNFSAECFKSICGLKISGPGDIIPPGMEGPGIRIACGLCVSLIRSKACFTPWGAGPCVAACGWCATELADKGHSITEILGDCVKTKCMQCHKVKKMVSGNPVQFPFNPLLSQCQYDLGCGKGTFVGETVESGKKCPKEYLNVWVESEVRCQ